MFEYPNTLGYPKFSGTRPKKIEITQTLSGTRNFRVLDQNKMKLPEHFRVLDWKKLKLPDPTRPEKMFYPHTPPTYKYMMDRLLISLRRLAS